MRLLRDLVGETLGARYRVVSRIAGGGMGEVYRAHDLLLDRAVAVKVLMPTLATDPALVERFKEEARAAARLNHPNVVAVHDWGSDDERTYYMVMEYVSGTDLRDVIVGRGPMDPAHACAIVASVCDALHAAHKGGLIHRDVKPENVLIARDGTVKVADFGIAALADAERTIPGGGILGTLRYLSPEQAAGGKATAMSDIWAAGALLFELMTGSPPQGGTGAELLRRRAEEPVAPPSSLESGVPAELDDIVLRACAIDPQQRFVDAASMADAIRRVAPPEELRSGDGIRSIFSEFTDEISLSDMAPTDFGGAARPRYRDRRKALRPAILLALVAVLALGAYAGATAIFGPKEVELPALVGLNQDVAQQRAEEAGFDLEIVDQKRHPELEEGRVISQDPPDGLLLQGETIRIVVSKGPPLVKIPPLAGVKEEAARAQLEEAGLGVGEVTYEFSTKQPDGSVIEAVSLKKRVEEGTPVDLVVSKGPRDIEVPSVVDLPVEKAMKKLTEAGFKPVRVDVYSDDVEEGFVVSTDPTGGSMAPEAGEITVNVSIGPEFKDVVMPDVRNMNVDSARAKLEGMGLQVKINQSCPGSTVIETDPAPGTKIKENSTVVLWVC